MIRGSTILLVEDEMLIALDVALAIEAAGGTVLGPATTTVEALALIEMAIGGQVRIDAALLDTNLADRDVTPVALRLVQLGIPIVVHSASGPVPVVKLIVPSVPWIVKPSNSHAIIAALADEIARVKSARRSETG